MSSLESGKIKYDPVLVELVLNRMLDDSGHGDEVPVASEQLAQEYTQRLLAWAKS